MRTTRLLALVLLLIPAVALAVTVQGKTYQPTATVEGKNVGLLGAGVREKWLFKVYAMAAYSESGKCDAKALVEADEVKYLRLDMLRDVSAEKMASTIGGSFDEHMPGDAPAELREQRRVFESYFKEECSKGTVLEFVYLPGTGTLIKQNGKLLGPALKGKAFHTVLWDIYFGPKTCCDALKQQILGSCGK